MAEQVRSLKTGIKYKDTPIGKIPVDWEVVKLEDICQVIGGSTPSTTRKEYWGGDMPFVTPTDITNLKGKEISDTEQKITLEGLSSCGTKLLPVGSILLTSRATIGACAINTKPMATNQGFANLVCNEKAFNWFIFYMMTLLKSELERLGSGSTFKEVSKRNIRSLFLPLPPLSEQKRIAEILTTVDEAIEKTSQIIEKTKEAKKGLMQRLLARGIGHKKFKKTEIGEIPEEWEVRKIEEIGEVVTGSTPSTKIKDYYGDKYMFVTPFDMNGYKYVRKTARMLSDTGIKVSRKVPKNSVMVVCIASIGKMAMAFEDCSTNQQINSIICNEKVDPHFIYYLMKSKTPKISSLSGKTAVPIVKKSLFSKLIIQIPRLTEQKQIAEILSSVDEEIEKETNHREQLETLKKGLMQVLLTGKIRVSV
jgi:type I restriction enzyme S subunit